MRKVSTIDNNDAVNDHDNNHNNKSNDKVRTVVDDNKSYEYNEADNTVQLQLQQEQLQELVHSNPGVQQSKPVQPLFQSDVDDTVATSLPVTTSETLETGNVESSKTNNQKKPPPSPAPAPAPATPTTRTTTDTTISPSTATKMTRKNSSTSTSTSSNNSDNHNHNNNNSKSLGHYIPKYLRSYVHPGPDRNGDFCIFPISDGRSSSSSRNNNIELHPMIIQIIAQCMVEGFLPMAYNNDILLPKLHNERSIIPLNEHIVSNTTFIIRPEQPSASTSSSSTNTNSGSKSTDTSPATRTTMKQTDNNYSSQPKTYIHIPKNIRKRSKHYSITINTAFDTVIYHCQQQHGGGGGGDDTDNNNDSTCWLYPTLLHIFRTLYHSTTQNEIGYTSHVAVPSPSSSSSTNKRDNKAEQVSVRLYSIEVWNNETKEFAAGEIGYTVGNTIYTSLTGCSVEDSAGSIQLATLGVILQYILPHFAIWDLGMDMIYKRQLGAQLIARSNFIQLMHTLRTMSTSVAMETMHTQTICMQRQQQQTQQQKTNTNDSPYADSCTLDEIMSLIKWPIQQLTQPINCRDIIDLAYNNNNHNQQHNAFNTKTANHKHTDHIPKHPEPIIQHLNKKQRKLLKKQQQAKGVVQQQHQSI